MKSLLIFCINITFLLFLGCNNNNNDDDDVQPQPDDPPTGSDTRHTVTMAGTSFSPSNLTINVGDTVVWMNSGTMIHTSTSGSDCDPDGTWDSGNINPGETFSYEFTDEGSFDYFCIPHCNLGMEGNITVEE